MRKTPLESWPIPTAEELRASMEKLRAANHKPKRESIQSQPRAARAFYDRQRTMIVMELCNGAVHSVPTHLLEGIAGADADLIDRVAIDSSGMMLHFEELDADFGVAGILTGWYGSPAWMKRLAKSGLAQTITTAQESGRRGGRSTSPVKLAAVRANGKKGGRPKKAKAKQLA